MTFGTSSSSPERLDLEPGPAKPEEFREFEDLTRKLVNVPKRELDEQRENES